MRRQQLERGRSVRRKMEDGAALYHDLSIAERNRGSHGISWFTEEESYDPYDDCSTTNFGIVKILLL